MKHKAGRKQIYIEARAMSMTPDNEQDLFDDIKGMARLCKEAMNSKKIGEMRQLVIRIYAITRQHVKVD